MPVNMSYCRFSNTLAALEECREHEHDDLGPAEDEARCKLIALCGEIASDYGVSE